MPSNTKYSWTTKCENGNAYQILIAKKNYSGGSSEPEVPANPITLTYNSVDNVFDPIRTSECGVMLESMTEHQYEEFFSSSYEDYQVQIKQTTPATNDIIWTGFIKGERHSEPWVVPPYDVNLTFTDGLSELKKEEFKTSGGDFFEGQMHGIEILRHCLNGLNADYGGPLDIWEIFNVYDNSIVDGAPNSAISQIFFDSAAYRVVRNKEIKAMSKYDVIYELLYSLNCHIVQKQSRWYIIRGIELDENNLTFRSFSPSVGSESAQAQLAFGTISHQADLVSVESAGNSDFVMLEQSGVMGKRHKLGGVEYVYRPNKFNYANGAMNANNAFTEENGVTDENLPKGWTRSAAITTTDCFASIRKASLRGGLKFRVTQRTRRAGRIMYDIEKDDVFAKQIGDPDPPELLLNFNDAYNVFTPTRYIDADEIVETYITTSDKLVIWGDFISYVPYPNAFATRFRVKITDSALTDYYLMSDGTWSLVATSEATVLVFLSPAKNEYTYAFEAVVFPFTGLATINFRVYQPKFDVLLNGIHVRYRELSLLYRINGNSSARDEVLRATITDSAHDTFVKEVFHGDGPDNISQGSIRVAGGAPTDLWHRFAVAENLPLAVIIIQDILFLMGATQRAWSGVIYQKQDHFWPYTKLFMTAQDIFPTTFDYFFAPLGFTWNMEQSEYDVQLTGLKNVAFTADTTEPGPPVLTENEGPSYPPSVSPDEGIGPVVISDTQPDIEFPG